MEGVKESVFMKRPDRKTLYHTNVSLSLENMWNIVSGPIELMYVGDYEGNQVVMVCNEEGRLRWQTDCPMNFWIDSEEKNILVAIYGTVFFCRQDGEELRGLDVEYKPFREWLRKEGFEV